MKLVAWSSKAYRQEGRGEAIYLTVDGREIPVCEAADVPDDFVWPPKNQVQLEFHADDKFEPEVPLLWRWGDLVFEGEVVRCVKGAPSDPELEAMMDNLRTDEADDFGFLREEA